MIVLLAAIPGRLTSASGGLIDTFSYLAHEVKRGIPRLTRIDALFPRITQRGQRVMDSLSTFLVSLRHSGPSSVSRNIVSAL